MWKRPVLVHFQGKHMALALLGMPIITKVLILTCIKEAPFNQPAPIFPSHKILEEMQYLFLLAIVPYILIFSVPVIVYDTHFLSTHTRLRLAVMINTGSASMEEPPG